MKGKLFSIAQELNQITSSPAPAPRQSNIQQSSQQETKAQVQFFDTGQSIALDIRHGVMLEAPHIDTGHSMELNYQEVPMHTQPDHQISRQQDNLFQTEDPFVGEGYSDDFEADLDAIFGDGFSEMAKQTSADDLVQHLKQTPPPTPSQRTPPPTPPKNPHAIFDQMAAAQAYSNTFDLGDIEMERRFDAFDKQMSMSTAPKPSPSHSTSAEYEQADTSLLAIEDIEIHEDLDSIGVKQDQKPYSPPPHKQESSRQMNIHGSSNQALSHAEAYKEIKNSGGSYNWDRLMPLGENTLNNKSLDELQRLVQALRQSISDALDTLQNIFPPAVQVQELQELTDNIMKANSWNNAVGYIRELRLATLRQTSFLNGGADVTIQDGDKEFAIQSKYSTSNDSELKEVWKNLAYAIYQLTGAKGEDPVQTRTRGKQLVRVADVSTEMQLSKSEEAIGYYKAEINTILNLEQTMLNEYHQGIYNEQDKNVTGKLGEYVELVVLVGKKDQKQLAFFFEVQGPQGGKSANLVQVIETALQTADFPGYIKVDTSGTSNEHLKSLKYLEPYFKTYINAQSRLSTLNQQSASAAAAQGGGQDTSNSEEGVVDPNLFS